MERKTFTLIGEDGKETIAEILFTYFSEEFQKNYVVFIPQDGNNTVAAASFVENGAGGTLEQIESDEEWELIEDLSEDFAKKLEEHQSKCHGNGHCHCGDEDCDCDCDGDCDEECCCHKDLN